MLGLRSGRVTSMLPPLHFLMRYTHYLSVQVVNVELKLFVTEVSG